jgi:rod shape determining protein RodA
MILLLMLVLVFGNEINGAKSWFEIGGLSLQPTEFAKFATALALAAYLNTKRHDLTKLKVIAPAASIIIFPALLVALQPDMGSSVVFFALFIVLFREGMSPYIFVSGLLIIILFFLTLILNNFYLTIILIALGILLVWFATRKWKLCLAGSAIFLLIVLVIYLLDQYVFESLGNELIIFISLILAGVAYAYYIYNKKATSVLIIYLFLVGSILYINSVDYAFNNILKPHQKERVDIVLGLKSD